MILVLDEADALTLVLERGSFFADSLGDADKRALRASADLEDRVSQENVEVDFDSTQR